MRTFILTLIIFVAICTIVEAFTDISATDSNIQYIGRWATVNLSGVDTKIAISSGTHLRFSFTGTSITLLFNMYDYSYIPEIEWSIDNSAYSRSDISATMNLVSGLSDTTHTIEIWNSGIGIGDSKWTTQAGVRLQYIRLDTGKSLSSWNTYRARKMIVIGDSIAEGQLVMTADANPNGRLAFPNLLGEYLKMDVYNVSFGGASLVNTFTDGAIPPAASNYPYIMSGISQNDPSFDIALIEVMNNDSSPISPTAQTNYTSLLTQIENNNPGIRIFCMGRIFTEPSDDANVQLVCESNGGTYISPVGWSYSHPVSPNMSHPNESGHAAITQYLLPYLRLGNATIGSGGIATWGGSGNLELTE